MSAAPISVPRASKPARVAFVDVLRLLALLQMINGHSADSVLAAELRDGWVFERYCYLRGLVSVAFLLAAGLAYHLTTFARFESYLADAPARRHRVRRAAMIVGIGFLLRFPFGAFGDDPVARAAAWDTFSRIDVLHCIGASILLLELVTSLAPSARVARAVAAGLGVGLVALAPLGQSLAVTPSSRWWVSWVSHGGGSPFPLAPWGAYVLLGAAAGGWILPVAAQATRSTPAKRLLLAGLATGAVAYLATMLPGADVPRTSSAPWFVLEKLAAVLVLLAALAWLCRDLAKLPAPLRVLTGETLTIYVFHLLALFWFAFSPHVVFGHTLSVGGAALVSLAMVVVCTAVGLAAPKVRGLLRTLAAAGTERLARAWSSARGRLVALPPSAAVDLDAEAGVGFAVDAQPARVDAEPVRDR